MNNRPEWLEDAPGWFQFFFSNHYAHTTNKVDMIWKLQILTISGLVAGAIAIICKVL